MSTIKSTAVLKVTVAILILELCLAGLPTPAKSQTEDSDRLATVEARVNELERAVADLETRVAALEGATSTPAAPQQAVLTPPSPAAPQGTTSREQPIPVGQPGTVGDWTVVVDSVMPNANEAIAAENSFNKPPDPGYQFFLVTLTATYNGADSQRPGSALLFKAVGASNVAYNTFSPGCGVAPNALAMADEVFAGGAIQGTVCFAVAVDDVSSLVMYAQPALSFDNARTWFSVQSAVTSANG